MTVYKALHVTLSTRKSHGKPKVKAFVSPELLLKQGNWIRIGHELGRLDLMHAHPPGYQAPHRIWHPTMPFEVSRAIFLDLLEAPVAGVEFEGSHVRLHLRELTKPAEGALLVMNGVVPELAIQSQDTSRISFAEFFRAPLAGLADRVFVFCPGSARYAFTPIDQNKTLFEVTRNGDLRFIP